MTLARLAIVNRIAELLTAIPEFQNRVWVNRVEPLQPNLLPACSVFGLSEDVDVFEDAPRLYRRKLLVSIEIHCGNVDYTQLSTQAHELAEKVEAIVLRDRFLNSGPPSTPLANDSRLIRAGVQFADGGAVIVAGATIELEVDYLTAAPGSDDASVANLERIVASYDLPAGEAVDAQDDVRPPQS